MSYSVYSSQRQAISEHSGSWLPSSTTGYGENPGGCLRLGLIFRDLHLAMMNPTLVPRRIITDCGSQVDE